MRRAAIALLRTVIFFAAAAATSVLGHVVDGLIAPWVGEPLSHWITFVPIVLVVWVLLYRNSRDA